MEVNKKLTAGLIITFLMAISGTYYLSQGDKSYYCQSKDMVMICEKLSSGLGTRCYYEETYKTCPEGWKEIEIGQEINKESENIYNENKEYPKQYLCNQINCTEKI